MASEFVVSTVVISKETPLHDPVKTFRAAIAGALDPVCSHGVLADSAASLDQDTPGYAELSRWVNSPASGLDERFSATLLCHERLRGGEVPGSDETIDALVRFWGGEPLRMPDLRRTLKSVGAAGLYSFTPISARELARQRFRFAAGCCALPGTRAGWSSSMRWSSSAATPCCSAAGPMPSWPGGSAMMPPTQGHRSSPSSR